MTVFITKVLGVKIAILKDILFPILKEINLFKNTVSAVYYENAYRMLKHAKVCFCVYVV